MYILFGLYYIGGVQSHTAESIVQNEINHNVHLFFLFVHKLLHRLYKVLYIRSDNPDQAQAVYVQKMKKKIGNMAVMKIMKFKVSRNPLDSNHTSATNNSFE